MEEFAVNGFDDLLRVALRAKTQYENEYYY